MRNVIFFFLTGLFLWILSGHFVNLTILKFCETFLGVGVTSFILLCSQWYSVIWRLLFWFWHFFFRFKNCIFLLILWQCPLSSSLANIFMITFLLLCSFARLRSVTIWMCEHLSCINFNQNSWVRITYCRGWQTIAGCSLVSVLVNTVLLQHCHTHLCIVYGCFHVIIAELFQRLWPIKPKVFATWPFIFKNTADS